MCLSLFCAAVRQYLRLGNLQRKAYSLTVLKAGKSKIRAPTSGRALLCPHMVGGRRAGEYPALSVKPLYKGTDPIHVGGALMP